MARFMASVSTVTPSPLAPKSRTLYILKGLVVYDAAYAVERSDLDLIKVKAAAATQEPSVNPITSRADECIIKLSSRSSFAGPIAPV